jgi:hypothetical protein
VKTPLQNNVVARLLSGSAGRVFPVFYNRFALKEVEADNAVKQEIITGANRCMRKNEKK